MARRRIKLVLAVLQKRFFRKRDPARIRIARAFGRGRAIEVRKSGVPSFRRAGVRPRKRRGDIGKANRVWRRLRLGTNRISSFGVWRVHARRAAPRVNRDGETRWHHMRGRHAADWIAASHTSSLSNMIMSTPPVAKV
jgi:hypothetical protein